MLLRLIWQLLDFAGSDFAPSILSYAKIIVFCDTKESSNSSTFPK